MGSGGRGIKVNLSSFPSAVSSFVPLTLAFAFALPGPLALSLESIGLDRLSLSLCRLEGVLRLPTSWGLLRSRGYASLALGRVSAQLL